MNWNDLSRVREECEKQLIIEFDKVKDKPKYVRWHLERDQMNDNEKDTLSEACRKLIRLINCPVLSDKIVATNDEYSIGLVAKEMKTTLNYIIELIGQINWEE